MAQDPIPRSPAMTTAELLPAPSPSVTRLGQGDEFELLCAVACVKPAPERLELFAGWDFSALDWSEFIRLAEHHGVLPLAASNLIENDCGRGLPPEVERSLRSSY